MPVYNAGKFLDNSIYSVLVQTYGNWELMCIDDGSTDASLDILKEYAKKDSRIKVLNTPSNLGPMGARRLGFEKSNGDYIVYLDADDKLSTDYLSSIKQRIEETGVDMVFPDLVHVGMGGQKSFFASHHVDKSEILSGMEGFADTFPWHKIGGFGGYKREIFAESTYHPYLDGNNFNADEVLQRIMLLKSKKIAFCEGVYFYTDNPESITHVLKRKSFCRLDANEALIQLAKDYDAPQTVLNKIYGFCFFCQLKGLAVNFFQSPMLKEDRCYALRKMKKAFHSYVKNPGVNSFYGNGKKAYLKARMFTFSWYLFMALCYFQAKFLIRNN